MRFQVLVIEGVRYVRYEFVYPWRYFSGENVPYVRYGHLIYAALTEL